MLRARLLQLGGVLGLFACLTLAALLVLNSGQSAGLGNTSVYRLRPQRQTAQTLDLVRHWLAQQGEAPPLLDADAFHISALREQSARLLASDAALRDALLSVGANWTREAVRPVWLLGQPAAHGAQQLWAALAQQPGVVRVNASALSSAVATVPVDDPGQLHSALVAAAPDGRLPTAVLAWEPFAHVSLMARLSGRLPLFVVVDDLRWADSCEHLAMWQALQLADVVLATHAFVLPRHFPDLPHAVLRWMPHAAAASHVYDAPNAAAEPMLLLTDPDASIHKSLRTLNAHMLGHPRLRGGGVTPQTLRRHAAALVDPSALQYVTASHFNVPATGALLVAHRSLAAPLAALGFRHGANCLLTSDADLPATLGVLEDPLQAESLLRMRARGQALVRSVHTVGTRAAEMARDAVVLSRAWHLLRDALTGARQGAATDPLCAPALAHTLPPAASPGCTRAPPVLRVCANPLTALLPTTHELAAARGLTVDGRLRNLSVLRRPPMALVRAGVRGLEAGVDMLAVADAEAPMRMEPGVVV